MMEITGQKSAKVFKALKETQNLEIYICYAVIQIPVYDNMYFQPYNKASENSCWWNT